MPRKKHPRSKFLDEDDSSGSNTEEVCVKPCVYHYCKRCASKRQTRYLPQEMFPNILLHHPAQVSNGARRRFWREWNLTIRTNSKIHRNLRDSTGGVLIQDQEGCSAYNGFYVEMRQGCLEICKFELGLGDLVPCSCNDLVMASDCTEQHTLSIMDSLTKQRSSVLPTFFSRIGCYSEFSLAFVEASMEYKVVKTGGIDPFGLKPRIAVLTVGVDKVWRHVDIQHLCPKTRRTFGESFVTGGYVHWPSFDFVLTLNMETEIIRQLPMPRLPRGQKKFLPLGRNLSLFNEGSKCFCDVWEMNPETGEWTTLLSFDLRPVKDRFKDFVSQYWGSIFPICWLADKEVLVFASTYDRRHWVTYNVKTTEIESLDLENDAKLYHLHAHVDSRLWLKSGFQVDRLRKKRQGIPISSLSCEGF